MIKDRGILFRGDGTEAEDFIVETQEVNYPLVKRKHRREGGGQAFAAGRMPNDLESGDVQVLSFLLFYAHVMPSPSPLGKAKEKGADHPVGPDR